MEEREIDFLIENAEKSAKKLFARSEQIALSNQQKVLDAFRDLKVSAHHFMPSSGYGYGDNSRDTLNALYARVFGAEDALVSPLIASGTHAITLALFGLLRPNDTLLSITGKPYDTLDGVIHGTDNGSLRDFGIKYQQIELANDKINLSRLKHIIAKSQPKVVYIQRSRGYTRKKALSIADIDKAVAAVREINSTAYIVVDNCYGEFIDTKEPCEVGADVVIGSLIKNVGGGIAPTGAYIAGTTQAIQQISYRFTSPDIGREIGSYMYGYTPFYQGLFLAPSVVKNAVKGSILAGKIFESLSKKVYPVANTYPGDIIRSIEFGDEKSLIAFCQAVQHASPIDSHAVPEAWDMPGYTHKIIMAAGAFVQGSSIELSADAPIKPPYTAYLQGGITYEHAKIALKEILLKLYS